ncbi:MAG: alkylation response protein AidB-like acyl-CoA dehydrogenase [Natronomonas sp.]|jgi:alkylation response protein AidB-like acyl-CoA dehydrogenase|uniref:acyl-CoA dehydrogenase family protein n=1 Tax=Natronomonas sp. TaxID=2184060 RepID=UPI0039892A67
MSAHLDDEHEMIRDSLREFLEAEIEPDLPEADRKPMTKDEAIEYQQMLGDLGIGPGDVEGDGFADPLTYAITSEEISRIWPSLNVTLNMSFPTLFAAYAGEETQEALGDKLDEGACIGCMAVTEPDGGSDTAHPGTTAEKDGDEYVINGEKTWVSNAPIADMALVVAEDLETEQRDFFIVDTVTNDIETRELEKLGWKGSPTGQIFFDDVRVPEDNKLMNAVMNMVAAGDSDIAENEMFQTADPLNAMFSYMRTGMAAMSVGIMQAAYEAALEYAKDREVFGGPIGGHQLVQEKLYDIRAGLETGRLLTYEAARKVAEGDPEARMYSSLAKGWVCEKSVEVADDAIQVYGGNGLSTEYPLERYYRDARTMTIPDGTTEIQQLVVGKELTGVSAYK